METPRRRGSFRWIVPVFVAVAGVAAFVFATREKPIVVVMTQVERGRVEETVSNTRAGTIKACRRAKVAPLISGRVIELGVRKGDRVRAGQVLLRLWNDDLESEVRAAQSAETTARSRRDEICRQARWASGEVQRQEQLYTQGIIAFQLVDRARADADAAHAGCRAAENAITEAQRRVGTVRSQLTRTVLTAPFAGVVAELTAELGEIVSPSPPGIPTPPAVDLVESGCLYVEAPLDEVDAPRVKVGARARVTMDAFPGETFAAKVRRIAPYVLDLEKQSRTVDVEAEFDDPALLQRLSPGYSADLEVILAERDAVLRIPSEAVLDRQQVYLVVSDHVELRSITRGLANWQFTEVTSGLQEGDTIVLSLDRAGIAPGVAVVAEPAAAHTPLRR